jgi:hypothetical protein
LGEAPRGILPITLGGGEEAAVCELDRDRGPCTVDGFDEPAQLWQDLAPHPGLVFEPAPVGGNGAVGQGGHADPALGYLAVVLDERLGHPALPG